MSAKKNGNVVALTGTDEAVGRQLRLAFEAIDELRGEYEKLWAALEHEFLRGVGPRDEENVARGREAAAFLMLAIRAVENHIGGIDDAVTEDFERRDAAAMAASKRAAE